MPSFPPVPPSPSDLPRVSIIGTHGALTRPPEYQHRGEPAVSSQDSDYATRTAAFSTVKNAKRGRRRMNKEGEGGREWQIILNK